MLGLLLTLFISLFSYCPIVYTVDHKENNIGYLDNSTRSYGAANDTSHNLILATNSDFMSNDFINDVAIAYSDFFYQNIPVGQFVGFDCIVYYGAYSDFDYSRGVWEGSNQPSIQHIRFYSNGNGYINNGQSRYFDYIMEMYDANYNVVTKYNFGLLPNSTSSYSYEGILYYVAIDNTLYNYLYTINGVVYNSDLIEYLRGTLMYYEYTTGYYDGYETGYNEGLADGYSNAIDDNVETDSAAFTIFTGIVNVGLLPINVFLQILNFEVFGINISGLVSGLLTIAIVVIILRVILGGKKE